jgi:type I restriction enzyme S subunit
MKDKMAKLIEITGKALSGEWGNDDNTGNGIPVLRTTNFTNEGIVNYNNVVTRIIEKKKIEEKYLRKGDIVIEKSGGSDKQPVGRVVYFDGPENTYLFNNFTGLLRVKDQAKWYPRYVFYSLFSNYHRGGTRAFQNKTTGLHNLKIDDFVSRCEVTEAGINEQIAACKRMDRVNDIIRMHQQQLQKLDELVKARFVELFGDPATNPYGWQQLTVNDVCVSVVRGPFGSALKKEFFVPPSDTTYKVYEQKHAIQKSSTIGTYYVTAEKYNELRRFECHSGDILMSCSGTMGELYQLPAGCERGIINQALCKFTLNERILPIVFLAYMRETIGNLETKGSGIQNIAAVSYVKAMPINLPPMRVQEQYATFVEQTDKSKVAVQKALDKAQLLFDSLMQKYFG